MPLHFVIYSQPIDFELTVYYTAFGVDLTSSGANLSAFNFSTAPATHPIFNDGLYFPAQDVAGNNLWVRVRHIADDPNGTAVGHDVNNTESSPFSFLYPLGFGGRFGFLYQFDIYRDLNLTGARANKLNGLFQTTVKVESIETLSDTEWVYFEILNDPTSEWVLNSINFSGANPGSNPSFINANAPFNDPGFSTTFPTGSNVLSVIDTPEVPPTTPTSSEFSISANNVSSFTYGFEYFLSVAYQGMRLSFGVAPLPTITSFTPTAGVVGTTVVITGTNFDPLAANNVVNFNGVTANTPTVASATSLTVTVPPGATTGPITVTTSAGTATSASPFTVTVPAVITQQPVSTTVCSGDVVQLTTNATGPGGVNYQWQKLTGEAASLSGLRWEVPVKTATSPTTGTADNPLPVSTVMGGTTGTSYSVTMRFRGVVELKTYLGGTTTGNWNVGGSPAVDGFNVYELTVSDPPGTYYLNAGVSNIFNCFMIDYEQTITVNGGATVELKADTEGGTMILNIDQFGCSYCCSRCTTGTCCIRWSIYSNGCRCD